ncbi:hypothetical protein N7495_003695 [Penicillium taxi]|uniref:uncharacterized protein n=1 Tax=Penicillium taxi TaxID=168475 RepID=UPI002545B8B6|nr:uncharacterized protein N7495_003695 [Penicillium taxi]KAJ5898951.1 hypothetical protein N7495_003695 [Penicillium taxi]
MDENTNVLLGLAGCAIQASSEDMSNPYTVMDTVEPAGQLRLLALSKLRLKPKDIKVLPKDDTTVYKAVRSCIPPRYFWLSKLHSRVMLWEF